MLFTGMMPRFFNLESSELGGWLTNDPGLLPMRLGIALLNLYNSMRYELRALGTSYDPIGARRCRVLAKFEDVVIEVTAIQEQLTGAVAVCDRLVAVLAGLSAEQAPAPNALHDTWVLKSRTLAASFTTQDPRIRCYSNCHGEDVAWYVHQQKAAWAQRFIQDMTVMHPPRGVTRIDAYPLVLVTDAAGCPHAVFASVAYTRVLSGTQKAQLHQLLAPFIRAEVWHRRGKLELCLRVTPTPSSRFGPASGTELFLFNGGGEERENNCAYVGAAVSWRVAIHAEWVTEEGIRTPIVELVYPCGTSPVIHR
jgi:hypothetical protein